MERYRITPPQPAFGCGACLPLADRQTMDVHIHVIVGRLCADLRVLTRIESCCLSGGIYLTIYADNAAQHYDVTLLHSGNPKQRIDRESENRYPIQVYGAV